MCGIWPEHPREAGIEEEDAVPSEEEGARLLANEAKERLRASGFTDQEIREWAETFVAHEGPGTADDLVAWIEATEHRRP